jgi:hypothetical protein
VADHCSCPCHGAHPEGPGIDKDVRALSRRVVGHVGEGPDYDGVTTTALIERDQRPLAPRVRSRSLVRRRVSSETWSGEDGDDDVDQPAGEEAVVGVGPGASAATELDGGMKDGREPAVQAGGVLLEEGFGQRPPPADARLGYVEHLAET